MRIVRASDSSILVTFGDTISAESNQRVLQLHGALLALAHPQIRNLHPAYSSLLVDFDPLRVTSSDVEQLISAALQSDHNHVKRAREVNIPVCYDREFALDLDTVAQHTGLSPRQVFSLHASAEYSVFFLGFAPGFAYLGGLASELRVPRLSSPRKHVPACSVGLAGTQTGIYPFDSPGGWQIIGRAPLRMFDSSRPSPSLLEPGDRVRFIAISRAEFDVIARTQEFRA